MCGSSPKVPPPPPPPQESKAPDVAKLVKRKNPTAMAGGSILTGPSGVTGVNTGGTLLGG